MPIVSIAAILLSALAPFEAIFSKPQKENFRRLLLGIILCLESRNISDIHQKTRRDGDQSSLNRFVTESPWDRADLTRARQNVFERHVTEIKPQEVYVIVDDTTAKKYGKKMEGVGWHYSDTDQSVILGHNMVSSVSVCAEGEKVLYQTPLGFSLYRKKKDCERAEDFKSKVELAAQIIEEFSVPIVTRVILLMDSWYASIRLLVLARQREFDYIVPIKSNRTIYLNGNKISLSKLAKPKAGWSRIKVKKETFWVKAMTVTLKGIGTVKLILSKRERYGTACKAFITNLLDWSAARILKSYAHRWAIETFYEDAKVHLGLDQYQIRKASAILKYWEIVFTAYQFLEEANRKLHWRKQMKTTGQKCLWVRKVFTQSLLDWLFERRDSLSKPEWARLRAELCF